MNGIMGQQSDGMLVRYGYRDTRSSAGRPERFDIAASDVLEVRCWHNYYGNPSYTFRMADGSTLYLVDDYGAMNGLGQLSRVHVARKLDLFAGWVR